MSTQSEKKCWWLVKRDSVNECMLCRTELKTVTRSALEHHSITNKHKNNFQKYKQSSSIQSSRISQINNQSSEWTQHANLNFQQLRTSENVHGVKQIVSTDWKPNQNESQKRSRDSEQNANEKKRRIEYRSAIKGLYDFYLSSKITKIPTDVSESLKEQFLAVLNEQVASEFCQMLHGDVGTKPFSLFLQDVPEREDRCRIGIAIRYYSDVFKKFICLFLNIIRLDTRDLQNKPIKIVDAIEETAKQFKFQLKNLIGIGVDIRSTKQKIDYIQVFRHLKRKYEIMSFYPILCTSNSIQKAFSNAFSYSFAGTEENLIKETYNWFHNNNNHMDKIWYDRLNVKQLQDYKSQFNDISWFFVPAALKNILKNWKGLNDHFNQIKEQSSTANSLYHKYNSKYYKACLSCVDEHLRDVIRANEEFESLEPNAVKMLSTFIKLKNEISILNDKYKAYGIKTLQLNKDIDNTRKSKIIPGLKRTILEIHVDFVEKFNKNLSFLDMPIEKSNDNYNSYDEIETNLKKLRILNDNKKNIIALSESDEITKSRIILEWNKLQSCLFTIPDTTKLQKAWEIIFNQKDSSGERSYREISFLAMKHLSLPLSDFNVRRIFYQINFKGINEINNNKLTTINNILRIQNFLKYINECTGNDSEVFLETIIKELMKANSACRDRAQNPRHVLSEEDDQILFLMKKRLNITHLSL